jgi:outer membrane receptor protein involved in Fe transport
MAERVLVIGDRGAAVDLDQNQTSTNFSSDFIADLPVAGRFYQNVLALAPGVQDADGDGNPNVNGARERDFKTSVGGISNVDPLTGTFLNQVSSDSIEDLTVVTAGAGAEFGRAQGGFAQIIQKQGSNDFEGVFGFLYSGKTLDGNGASNTTNEFLPDFYLYQPSLTVSGPIVKDKLWYRLSQEVIRREDPVVFASGGNVDTIGTKRFSTDDQLTWQVSNRNKLALNFRADPLTQTNVGISAINPVESTETLQTGGPTYTLTWTAPYSPSLLVDTTVAYQDTTLKFTPTVSGVSNNCPSPAFTDTSAYQCFNALSGLTSGSSERNWEDARQRLTVKSDATWFAGRIGKVQSQQFKVGIVVENERYFRTLTRRPTVLWTGANVGTGVVTPWRMTASMQPVSQQNAAGNTWGIYGEDVIRPISNLSITVGLRIEQENISAAGFVPLDPQADSDGYIAYINSFDPPLSVTQRTTLLQNSFPSYEDRQSSKDVVEAQFPGTHLEWGNFAGQQSNWTRYRQPDNINIHNTNLSPRLSIGWDPWNDGKTKFSFSIGRYYDKIFLGAVTTEAEPVLANFGLTKGTGDRILFEPSFSYTSVNRDLQTPYNDEFSFAVERTFWQENTISLTYIHRAFKNQLQDIDTNQVPGDYGKCKQQQYSGDKTLEGSTGTGMVTDPYTGEQYFDNVDGPGDGRLDDCVGKAVTVTTGDPGGPSIPSANFQAETPDGIADFYVLNPAWGSIFMVGNYNQMKYDGVILEFVRRQYKNWQMQASYTWSQATGDAEDFNLSLGDDRSTLEDEKGYLSYDRRHSLKVNATCLTPWGFRIGGTALWESGLPYSLLYRDTSQSTTLPLYEGFNQSFTSLRTRYLTGQRNDQRNDSSWLFNLKLVKEINLPKGMNLQLDADIFNLFNSDYYYVYNDFLKSGQIVNGAADAQNKFGRQYQVGMRLAF